MKLNTKKLFSLKNSLISLGIFFLVIFLYHRTLGAYFVGEDYEWWTKVRGLNLLNSFRLFLPPQIGGIILPPYYRPLVGWTVWLDTIPLGMTPVAFHLTSLAFHLINIIMLGFLGFYLFKGNLLAVFLTALLFATFPFHSEAVVWSVGGRYDLMITTFYLLSLLAVVKYFQKRQKIWGFLGLLAFYLSLLSKESAATFPIASIVILRILYPKTWIKVIKKYKPYLLSFFLVFLFYFIFRILALKTINPYTLIGHAQFFFISRLFRLYLLTLGLLIFLRLSGRLKIVKKFNHEERNFWLLFLLLGIVWLPTANLPTQERQLYLPSAMATLGFTGFLVAVIKWVRNKSKTVKIAYLGILSFILIFDSFLLYRRNEDWRQAGIVAESITNQLSKELENISSDEIVYLINSPDSFNKAYIYRTHLKEALEFKMKREIPRLILTPQTNGIKSGAVVSGPKTARLQSEKGFVLFWAKIDEQGRLVLKTAEYQAAQLDKKTLEVVFLAEDFDFLKSNVFICKEGKIERF